MKEFLSDDFLLDTQSAKYLYFEHAKEMPIIDYHCHLPPDEIASDKRFANLTQIWLKGDHYKWRAMRANGIDEKYITGNATDLEKFQKWAETVPFTMRNPLYHWTHMELKKPFGIKNILNSESADTIYNKCTELLQTTSFSTKNLLREFKVQIVCTTDDPVDSLDHHAKIKKDNFEIKVFPTFRPDKALGIENIQSFNKYLNTLSDISETEIKNYNDLLDALKSRHTYFHEMGCRLSDHGLEQIYFKDYSENDIEKIFTKARKGKNIESDEVLKFKSALLIRLAEMDHEKGWTQQFHLGAIRNNNKRMIAELGPDTGYDSIGDFEMAKPLSRFFNALNESDKLTKTILYNLNPKDNYLIATMLGNFNDGKTIGKMQFGSGWWFLDQKEGMEWQINALSNNGLLSRFVGMLTDSRSFLSYPRHDYFRRILCNMLGNDIENGLLPNDKSWIGKMVENICYNNAKNFFNFN